VTTRKLTIKRIDLGSALKIGCIVSVSAGLLFGFIFGIVVSFFSSLIASTVTGHDPGLGAGAIVVFPVFFAVLFGITGSLAFFLVALIYNIAAGMTGGIELETVTDAEQELPSPVADGTSSEEMRKKTHRVWRQPLYSLAARRGGAIR